MSKNLYSKNYYNLLTEATNYRKTLQDKCGARFNYIRLFTEPRKNGLRSKFWGIGRSFPLKKIENYVANNPIVKVGNKTYNVKFKKVHATMSWMANSYSLHFTLISK